MSRLKQIQIIDTAIQNIVAITQSQCSLSVTDLIVLDEALERLQFLRRKKGKTNQQIRNEIVQLVVILIKIFSKD
jgi:hypothetical protein